MEKMKAVSVRVGGALFSRNARGIRRNSALFLAAVAACASTPMLRAQNMPVAVTGWNEDLIGDTVNRATSVSTDLAASLLPATGNEVLYAQGLTAAGYGSGTISSSASNTYGVPTPTQFQLQSFTSNNGLLIGAGGTSPLSATLTLTNPSAFSSLSFLMAFFDSSASTSISSFGYQYNYHDGTAGSTPGSSGYYWDNPSPQSKTATQDLGMLNVNTGATSSGVHLYEVQVNPNFLNSGKLIDSITFQNDYTTPIPFAVLAVSGTKVSVGYPITYKGGVSSLWNTTDANWYNTSTGSGSNPVLYNDNFAVTFGDTATGSTNITIASAGVRPLSVNFNNNSKTYSLSGGGIGGTTGVNLNGNGTVVLNNANTFTGTINISSGKLVLGASGALAGGFQTVNIAAGATLELHGNSNLSASTALKDLGTVHVIGANVTGIFIQTTGQITIDPGSSFNSEGGGIDGTVSGGGTLILSNSLNALGNPIAGAMTLETPSSLQCNTNVSGGSAITIGDAQSAQNNMTAGLVGTTPLLLTLSGTGYLANKTGTPNGALLGADYSSDVWAGNINISGSTYISGGNNGTLTIAGTIKGPSTAAVGFSSDQYAVTVLSAVNTYTGETQVVAPAGSPGILQLGVNNAINPASGLNLAGAGSNAFDLNGFNTSVAYLTWNSSAAGSLITNTGGTPATLTIVQKAGTNSYGGQISDGNAPLSLAFSGTGNQTLTGNNSYSGGTTINSGVVTAASVSALGTGAITVNGGALILANTSAGAVFAMLQSGDNNGAWNGSTGINSTAANADPSHIHAVGMIQPATATTFAGQPLGPGDVAVMYTYYGDANLDGKVDGSDYSLIDAGFASHGALTGWFNGDFNYDGTIDGTDYALIDNAFNNQGSPLTTAALVATATAEFAATPAAVPEPAAGAVVILGMLAARRRSRLR